MTNAEELRERLRVMFVRAWAGWSAEERSRLLAKLPQYQREGVTKMIEDYQRNQK